MAKSPQPIDPRTGKPYTTSVDGYGVFFTRRTYGGTHAPKVTYTWATVHMPTTDDPWRSVECGDPWPDTRWPRAELVQAVRLTLARQMVWDGKTNAPYRPLIVQWLRDCRRLGVRLKIIHRGCFYIVRCPAERKCVSHLWLHGVLKSQDVPWAESAHEASLQGA